MLKKFRLSTVIALLALTLVVPLLTGCPVAGDTGDPGIPSSPWKPTTK